MSNRFVSFTPPNAARLRSSRSSSLEEQVAALVTIIQRNTTGPLGERPTLDDIAGLLGIATSTLDGYRRPPRSDRSRRQRGVPYPVLYCLEVLSISPQATATALWGNADGRE